MIKSRVVDMAAYPRRAHFEYFSKMANPYAGITVNVDITDFLFRVKNNCRPFFHSMLYCVMGAANAVPEFRQRIVNGGIVEFESCQASYTVALENGTYCYCQVECGIPYEEFLPYAKRMQEEAMAHPSVDDDEDTLLSMMFVSSTPWFSFTNTVQPVPSPADSNPRIVLGRFFSSEGRTLMPISLLCNHALVDGLHFARFLDELNERLNSIG